MFRLVRLLVLVRYECSELVYLAEVVVVVARSADAAPAMVDVDAVAVVDEAVETKHFDA